LPDRDESLKRLHRPNRFRLWLRGFQHEAGLKVFMSVDPFAVNAGLMKPRRGFAPVIGEKLGAVRKAE